MSKEDAGLIISPNICMKKNIYRAFLIACVIATTITPIKVHAKPLETVATMDMFETEETTDFNTGSGNNPSENPGAKYSSPENTRHVNASFRFKEKSNTFDSLTLTYPLTMKLQEIDTKDKLTITIKSSGHILEIEQGDYEVTSLKDSGKVPISVNSDVLHLYENTDYTIEYRANRGLKMFQDFIADNIFLLLFFAVAAFFYDRIIVRKFTQNPRNK